MFGYASARSRQPAMSQSQSQSHSDNRRTNRAFTKGGVR